MDDQDSEPINHNSGSGPDGIAAPPVLIPTPPQFSTPATVFWSLAVFSGLALLLGALSQGREQMLQEPDRYLELVLGRNLDATEYTARMPAWQKLINSWDSSDTGDTLQESIALYRRFLRAEVLFDPENAVRSLAVLLAEAGELDEAVEELNRADLDRANPEFVRAFRAVYVDGNSAAAVEDISRSTVESLTPEWARDRFSIRLANGAGNEPDVVRIQERLEARGRTVQDRVTVMSGITLFLAGAGLLVLAVWLRQRAGLQLGNGIAVSSWTVRDGYAVLVRGTAWGLLVAVGLGMLAETIPLGASVATLVSALPLFWLARKSLLEPNGESWGSCFGLALPFAGWGRAFGFSLAILGLMVAGETVLFAVTGPWDEATLVESIPEETLLGSWPEVLSSVLDGVVWAPVVEEIVFRGLLYTTLRRWLPMWSAAAASGAMFSVIHGYSLQGFLIIFWSGFLWALAYEKSRTLWPGIICHSLSNSLAMVSPIVIYRLQSFLGFQVSLQQFSL